MSARTTWIKGKMWFPDDIDPADIDWVKPLVAYPAVASFPDVGRSDWAMMLGNGTEPRDDTP
jgi:hypothetical protein